MAWLLKEKVSGGKADLVLRFYAIFSHVTSHSSAAISTSSVDDTLVNSFTYYAIFRISWTTDLRSTPPFTFIQLYEYLVIRTVKYKHILVKSTSYKKLKAFQFFY